MTKYIKGKINYGQFVVWKWKGGGIEVLRATTYGRINLWEGVSFYNVFFVPKIIYPDLLSQA